MAYALNRNVGRAGRKTILVFGLGGGTLNVSLLAIEKGMLGTIYKTLRSHSQEEVRSNKEEDNDLRGSEQ
ncbi:hypothetical protein EJ110_NYTH05589 [Nymphaea thermarum]|nr:hypothetical protein EJ110_NYTH05589 [Nymphaea thermarum]